MVIVVTMMIVPINPVLAETGQGKDVFKVIMTIFGVATSNGDLVTMLW
jgi:hypothetical protein